MNRAAGGPSISLKSRMCGRAYHELPDDNPVAAQSSETDPRGPIHADGAGCPLRERKTLVLTWASPGIGRATERLFSEAGWRIISCARQPFDAVRCPWDSEGIAISRST